MWDESVMITQIIKSTFYIEIEVDSDCFGGLGWIVFVYMSTEENIWKRQWNILKQKKRAWGRKWLLEGDFNDILSHEDKQSRRRRIDSSFTSFRSYIEKMDMVEISFSVRR